MSDKKEEILKALEVYETTVRNHAFLGAQSLEDQVYIDCEFATAKAYLIHLIERALPTASPVKLTSAEQSELIHKFSNKVGVNFGASRHWLEIGDWDFEKAKQLYLFNGRGLR